MGEMNVMRVPGDAGAGALRHYRNENPSRVTKEADLLLTHEIEINQ